MSNPNTFMTNYVAATQQLVSILETLRTYNDMITQDGTLITRYFSSANNPRTDISSADVSNAQSAAVQMLFTFDSGSPTQKSYLFKLLP